MISLTAIWVLTAGLFCLSDVPQTDRTLHITMNPNVVTNETQVCLGQIFTLSGPDELVNKARGIALGIFSAKGQVLYIDRNTILSRLASVGIDSSRVKLAGAEKTRIQRNEKCIDSQQIMNAARAYLDKQMEGQKISSVQVVSMAAPVVLSDPNAQVELTTQLSRYQTPGAKKVTVTASQDGVPIARREVAFAVKFIVQHAVAQRDLSPGMILDAENIKIEQVESSSPQSADWKEPFGLVVRRRIPEGSRIHPDWIGPAQAPVMIRRNQQVLVQLDTGTMFLSAPGQALDEGRVGELIRVKRGQRPDERIIYCMVQADGTVRPQI